ncbi:MAG TPA: hypothetical protein VGR35_10420 [Tepidisphaeraceae bacterium]|nr:hypothetical protein [Tepidisphaeraceae bacterium]
MTDATAPATPTVERDPNVTEIRAIRAAIGAGVNYDIDAYFEELKRFETEYLRARGSDSSPRAPRE